MGEAGLDPAPVYRDGDQRPPLRLLDGGETGEAGQQLRSEGLAEGEEFEHAAHRIGEQPDPGVDQLAELRRHRRLAAPLPHSGDGSQCCGAVSTVDELAQEQRIALAGLPDPPRAVGLELPAECCLDELAGLGLGQRLQLEPVEVAVLPQRGDGVRRPLPGPQRQHEWRHPAYGQLVHHGRGQVVEQVGVVDADDNAGARRVGEQGCTRPPDQRPGIGHVGGGHQMRQRAQRHGSRRGGRDRPPGYRR